MKISVLPYPTCLRALFSILLLCVLPLGLASCQEEERFGMPAERFAAILRGEDPAPILALEASDLDKPGPEGPFACYALGLWLERRIPKAAPTAVAASPAVGATPAAAGATTANQPVPEAAPDGRLRVIELFRLAFERGRGLQREEAGRALVIRLSARAVESGTEADAAALLEVSGLVLESLGQGWILGRARLLGLERLGRDAELLAELEQLRSSFPGESGKATDELLWYEAIASLRLGLANGPLLFTRILVERSATPWSDRALAFAEREIKAATAGDRIAGAAAGLEPELLEAARLRSLIRAKDYAGARRAALRVPALALAAPTGMPELVAEAGKAFLYASAAEDGLGRFGELAAEARKLLAATGRASERARLAAIAWNAEFYRARFLRSLGRDAEAIPLLEALVPLAGGLEDAEAALWYATEARIKRAPTRRAGMEALTAGAAASRAPVRLADLADAWLREAIGARDWGLVDDFALGAAPRIAPALAARAAYAAGRAAELGLPGAAPAEAAADRFRRVLSRADAPAYYRILAARRLGETSLAVPPPGAAPSGAAPSGALAGTAVPQALPPPHGAEAEREGFLLALLPWGLAEEAWASARAELASWNEAALRRLSTAFAAAGRPAESMRAILALAARPGFIPGRGDWELMFPRPYLAEIRALDPAPAFPEEILFGLLRSESFFRADVVSSAGAVGLSQLMPATAAEIARRMRLGDYDLRDPADNLAIGLRFFGELLTENGGRSLRAMWAYNAGRSRLRAWIAEAGDLPDDLLLESLGIEETRQYGRNILEASVRYGTLWYGKSEAAVVDLVIEGLGKGWNGATTPGK